MSPFWKSAPKDGQPGCSWPPLPFSPLPLPGLRRALELAEPGSYVRLFVEEGEPLREMLAILENLAGREWPYLHELLAAFPNPPDRAAKQTEPCEGLVEPLTARELEVLRLISRGLSNQEIADQLVVTLNTIKKHNYSIFQKLGVTNRAQAILAARALGLDEAKLFQPSNNKTAFFIWLVTSTPNGQRCIQSPHSWHSEAFVSSC